jgi:hypothetical protein
MIIEFQHPIGPGLTLVCEIEYLPYEAGTDTSPPAQEEAFFCSASLLGVDVTDILADHLKDYIRERALCSMQPSL